MASRKRKQNGGNNENYEQRNKRSRQMQRSGVQLLDLPLGPLHLIISKVDPIKQRFLRGASKQLQIEHTDCVMHKYKSCAYRHLRKGYSNELEQLVISVYQVLALSTDFFIHSGYDSIFGNRLLRFYKQLTIGMELDDVIEMYQFVHEFYGCLESSPRAGRNNSAARTNLQHRRLLYTISLLNLLRNFRKFNIVSSGMNLLHWNLEIEVSEVYVGVLERDVTNGRDEHKLVDFITIISELLVCDMFNDVVSRCTEFGNATYVYGLKRKRGVRLHLMFSVLAPLTVHNLLEDAVNGKLDLKLPVPCPAINAMSVDLEVKSRGSSTLYNNTMHISVLSLF